MVLLSKVEIVDMVERIKILNHLGKIKESDSLLKALENGVIDPYISDYIYYSEMTAEEIDRRSPGADDVVGWHADLGADR